MCYIFLFASLSFYHGVVWLNSFCYVTLINTLFNYILSFRVEPFLLLYFCTDYVFVFDFHITAIIFICFCGYRQRVGGRGLGQQGDFGQFFNIPVLSVYKEFHNEVIMS